MDKIAHEYLGSGYDLSGMYADGVSIKKKIFNLSKVPEKDLREIPNTRADYFSVEGKSYEEFQSSLAAKAGVSGSYGLFSGSVEASYSSTDLSIAESSFVSIKLFMRYTTWKLQVRAQEYMYPSVIEDFKTMDGKWLIENYGRAVVMGMDIGGQWSDNLSVSKLYENSTSNVAVAMEAAYGSFVSGKGSTEIKNTLEREKSIASRRVNADGGDPKFAPGLDEWQASVKENPAFMNFTSDGLIMIWEFFPEYEEKLRQGFEEYTKSKQLNIKKRYLIEAVIAEGYKYNSDANSGADRNLDLYKPATSETYNYIGVNGNDNKCLIVKELSPNFGAMRKPDGWMKVWNDRSSWNSDDYSCWIPVPPPNYVALGVYCRFKADSQNPPSDEEAKGLVVLHGSLVKKTDFTTTDIWSSAGSGAAYELTLGRLPSKALWPSNTTDPDAGILPSKYTIKDEYIQA